MSSCRSISKPVAATGALRMVEEGRLNLDTPINGFLTSWQLPDNEFTGQTPVTIRAKIRAEGYEGEQIEVRLLDEDGEPVTNDRLADAAALTTADVADLLADFDASPTPYHAVSTARAALEATLAGPDAVESEIGMLTAIPDGTRLLFIRKDKDDKPQVWLLRLDGGDAEQVTE